MRWANGCEMRVVCFGVLVGILLRSGVARSDFVFGEPVNLGPPINVASDGCPVFTADGLSMFIESDRGGEWEVWLARRETLDAPWQEPVNISAHLGAGGGFAPNISPDGLTLYFSSWREGGLGMADLYVTTRASEAEPWAEPINLGANVNSPTFEDGSQVSADGLALYYTSDRFGTAWDLDIWMTMRATLSDAWAEAVKLGPNINTTAWDFGPHVLPGGRVMLFGSDRPGGVGGHDHWITRRAATSEPWGVPGNLGPAINSTADDRCPFLAADGCVYFHSDRQGPAESFDIWRAPVQPVVDLDGDGVVDSADICFMIDNWHTDDPRCDIGPTAFGDGVVDVEDLIVLVEHMTADTGEAQ